ncbi:MAG: site-specific integrase [Actinobacteria bacterium]|nr:site-specific integrase [Actinomycetota bacterium]
MKNVPWAKVRGPLAPFADGFRAELDRLGYTPASREYKVNQMANLSRWLEGEGLGAGDVDAVRLAAFLSSFGATRKQTPTEWAMRPLLGWLRAEGVIGPALVAARGPLDVLMDDYRRWMAADRELAARTMGRYEQTARRFLGGLGDVTGGSGVEGVTGEAVTGFLLGEVARGLAPGSLQGRVAELRSLLRFLYLRGFTDTALAGTVPPVPGWKDRTVPPRLAAAQVRALLDSCDRATRTGVRDFAMLMLLARLGLRAAEVAGLVLDDIDWRAGEVVVRGKGRREDRLPLPADVGEAVATYLVEVRARVECRAMFLTVVAPHRPLSSTAVSQMVWRQCARAGLTPVRAHRLRHALATDLLDQGASLPEIGQVLRHRDLATTAAYAKVDHSALRELALPWPAVAG